VIIYSVVLMKGREVEHCDLTFDGEKLLLERLAARGAGRSRRGLSKHLDLFLYKIEKMRTKERGTKEKVLELKVDEIKCWRVEEHTAKGLAREYENTVLFILKSRDGRTYRMLVSKKAFHLLDKLTKRLKNMGVEKCKKV